MVDWLDMFKPYSPEIRGDLFDYLRERCHGNPDNFFEGSEYYFVMRDAGLLLPGESAVRVGHNPLPDVAFIVNDAFLLQGFGRGHENMSCVGAEVGVFDPEEVLEGHTWSVIGLNLEKLFDDHS